MFSRFVMFTFWNFYVLELLRLETITFSDATLRDINAVFVVVLIIALKITRKSTARFVEAS